LIYRKQYVNVDSQNINSADISILFSSKIFYSGVSPLISLDENWNAAARKAYVFLDVCLIAILGDNLKKITGSAAR